MSTAMYFLKVVDGVGNFSAISMIVLDVIWVEHESSNSKLA